MPCPLRPFSPQGSPDHAVAALGMPSLGPLISAALEDSIHTLTSSCTRSPQAPKFNAAARARTGHTPSRVWRNCLIVGIALLALGGPSLLKAQGSAQLAPEFRWAPDPAACRAFTSSPAIQGSIAATCREGYSSGSTASNFNRYFADFSGTAGWSTASSLRATASVSGSVASGALNFTSERPRGTSFASWSDRLLVTSLQGMSAQQLATYWLILPFALNGTITGAGTPHGGWYGQGYLDFGAGASARAQNVIGRGSGGSSYDLTSAPLRVSLQEIAGSNWSMTLFMNLTVQASVDATAGSSTSHSFFVDADFSQGASLGRVHVVDGQNADVSDEFSLITASGRDLNAVITTPEPASALLLAAGLFIMGAVLRRPARS